MKIERQKKSVHLADEPIGFWQIFSFDPTNPFVGSNVWSYRPRLVFQHFMGRYASARVG